MSNRSIVQASVLFLLTCAAASAVDGAYRSQVNEWRQGRESELKADGGWLTVTGLFWLRDGANSVGSGPANDVVLPEGAPASVGEVKIENGKALFTASDASVRINGKPARSAELHASGPTDVVSAGSVDFLLLKRGSNRLALRVKDKNSALRTHFTHLSWYPIQEDWRITGKFLPAESPGQKIVFDTVIGEQESLDSPGYVEFQRAGQTYKIQAARQGKRLFFVIRDLTSGKTTYPASRFLYADLPGADGSVVLDFNKAENPPCAFTPYATCPLPPPQNRLHLSIDAGEQKYEGSAH